MASGAADERNGDPARDRPDPPSRALPLHGHPRHPHRPRLQRPPRRLQRPRPPCRLALLAAASGLPLARPLLQFCRHLAATLLSAAACFPLLVRTSVAYAVACAYAGKKFRPADFFAAVRRTWRRLISTYLWVCASISACLACRAFAALGYPPEIVVYPALLTVLAFSMAYAHTIIACNLASVISVLEEVSGPRALLRSVRLIRGQTQARLLMFLGSTIGMAFVEGLFEHRVKTLSHGDGSSRLWEAPLLVLMYSFVVLIDSTMSAMFYFTCRSSVMEESDEDGRALKGTQNASPQVDRYCVNRIKSKAYGKYSPLFLAKQRTLQKGFPVRL